MDTFDYLKERISPSFQQMHQASPDRKRRPRPALTRPISCQYVHIISILWEIYPIWSNFDESWQVCHREWLLSQRIICISPSVHFCQHRLPSILLLFPFISSIQTPRVRASETWADIWRNLLSRLSRINNLRDILRDAKFLVQKRFCSSAVSAPWSTARERSVDDEKLRLWRWCCSWLQRCGESWGACFGGLDRLERHFDKWGGVKRLMV